MLQFFFLGCAFFPFLFFVCLVWLRRRFSTWKETDVTLTSKRFVSATHAFIATVCGVIVTSSCKKDVTRERHWLVPACLCLNLPYMVYDICAMYYHWCKDCQEQGATKLKKHTFGTIWSFFKRECLLVLHHLVFTVILIPFALFHRQGLGDFFIGCFFIMELSTPFLSLGKILIQFHLQNTLLYKANGILLLLTFFFCRIAVFPYMCWTYSSQHGIPFYEIPFNIPLFWTLGSILILAPQLYWFYLLCRKALHLFHKSGSKKLTTVQ